MTDCQEFLKSSQENKSVIIQILTILQHFIEIGCLCRFQHPLCAICPTQFFDVFRVIELWNVFCTISVFTTMFDASYQHFIISDGEKFWKKLFKPTYENMILVLCEGVTEERHLHTKLDAELLQWMNRTPIGDAID